MPDLRKSHGGRSGYNVTQSNAGADAGKWLIFPNIWEATKFMGSDERALIRDGTPGGANACEAHDAISLNFQRMSRRTRQADQRTVQSILSDSQITLWGRHQQNDTHRVQLNDMGHSECHSWSLWAISLPKNRGVVIATSRTSSSASKNGRARPVARQRRGMLY